MDFQAQSLCMPQEAEDLLLRMFLPRPSMGRYHALSRLLEDTDWIEHILRMCPFEWFDNGRLGNVWSLHELLDYSL